MSKAERKIRYNPLVLENRVLRKARANGGAEALVYRLLRDINSMGCDVHTTTREAIRELGRCQSARKSEAIAPKRARKATM